MFNPLKPFKTGGGGEPAVFIWHTVFPLLLRRATADAIRADSFLGDHRGGGTSEGAGLPSTICHDREKFKNDIEKKSDKLLRLISTKKIEKRTNR